MSQVTITEESEPLIPKDPASSTFQNTVVNSVNLLMGMGIISIPYAIASMGWIFGIGFLLFFSSLTCYSASLVGWLCSETQSANLFDIGQSAFGPKAKYFIGILTTLELFTASVAMIVLFTDSLAILIPNLDRFYVITGCFISLTPITFTNQISRLSSLSFIGVFSLLFLVFTLCFDGLSTDKKPGSLLQPEQTFLFSDFNRTVLAIGLLIVGLDGHAVFPSLYKDMKEKINFSKAMICCYSIVCFIYVFIGSVGYLMFGQFTDPEIIRNLNLEKYNRHLALITLILITINPLTKYPLIIFPVNLSVESMISVNTSLSFYISRTTISFVVCIIALCVPSFIKVVGFMGSTSSIMISCILPLVCYIKIKENNQEVYCYFERILVLIVAMIMIVSIYGVFL